MYPYRFIVAIALIFTVTLSTTHYAVAQDYYIKKEDTSLFSRLFGWGKKTERKEDQQQNKKKAAIKKRNAPKTVEDLLPPPTLRIKSYATDDTVDEFDLEDFQKEVFGECTEQDKKSLETVDKMFDQFDEETKAFQEDGKAPTGYEYPKGQNIDDYEEEDFQDVKPAGVHEFMEDEKNSEKVIGVMMRCKNWKTVMEEKKIKDKERAERQRKRKQRGENTEGNVR